MTKYVICPSPTSSSSSGGGQKKIKVWLASREKKEKNIVRMEIKQAT
jgi:hypothetical protein